jgi:hypothetical protein
MGNGEWGMGDKEDKEDKEDKGDKEDKEDKGERFLPTSHKKILPLPPYLLTLQFRFDLKSQIQELVLTRLTNKSYSNLSHR